MPTIINNVSIPIQDNGDGTYTMAQAVNVNLTALQNQIQSTHDNYKNSQIEIQGKQEIIDLINKDIGDGTVLKAPNQT